VVSDVSTADQEDVQAVVFGAHVVEQYFVMWLCQT